MSVARDKAAPFEKDQHSSHGAGIGGHASGQRALSESMASRESRQQHELVGGYAEFSKLHVRATMQKQIGCPKLKRQSSLRFHQARPRKQQYPES
jgi:hypothetical protein